MTLGGMLKLVQIPTSLRLHISRRERRQDVECVLQQTHGRLRSHAAVDGSKCVSPLQMVALMIATAFIRRQWLDCIAAAPPILLMLAFKIYIRQTAGQRFKYYEPSPEEIENDHHRLNNEKRLRHSDMEKRFLHPALQADKLFTVMVHKSQEALAREVLSAYPWFSGSKHDKNAVMIKAVREVSRLVGFNLQAGQPGIRSDQRRTSRRGASGRMGRPLDCVHRHVGR